MKNTFRKCFRCNSWIKKETSKVLRKEYPFYCPYCDENMGRLETYKVRRKCKQKGTGI